METIDQPIKKGNMPSITDKVKLPPHSLEAEQAVLGAVMLDNTVWDRVTEKLSERDFYKPEHRFIFRVMSELARRDQPLDVLTIADALQQANLLAQAGSEACLFELAQTTPSSANVAAYSTIVRERSILRQLIGVAGEIADVAYHTEGRTSHELLDEAERKVFEIAEVGARSLQGPVPIKELLTQATERIDELYHSDDVITGIPTGFTDLDEMTAGLQRGDLVIIAGRPSMGKTVLGVNVAEHVAIKSRLPVLIFSMEMPGDALAIRMMSSLGRINQHHLRTGKINDDDWVRITSVISMLSEAPLYIDDSPGLSPTEVRSRARRLTREHGQLGLVVIDYLQLMSLKGHSENRTAEISEISRSLKALAKELNVPVVALSQLNRSLEQRHDRRPVMSDLRESGAIEQDADVIAFIYRDEVYNENSPDKGTAEIIIAKQRNGPIGKVRLTFFGQYTCFENFASTNYLDAGSFV